MKILAVECSAGSASAAITENGRILSVSSVNVKITHSQTLMPMIKGVLNNSFLSFADIDGIAVSAGPGSFTGIRIGIAAVKGLAAPRDIPCAAVSSLRAMVEPFRGENAVICAVMDARCNQVYNALFEINGDRLTRLCEDRALLCNELTSEISALCEDGKRVIVTGDGTDLFYPFVSDICDVCAANETVRFQNAASVGLVGEEMFKNGDTVTAERLLPVYLRLPQAERELKAKQAKGDILK